MRCLVPLALLGLLFTGCAGDASRVVGIWMHNDPQSPVARQFTFQSDGQFSYISRLKVKPTPANTHLEENLVGTYDVKAGILTLNFTTPGVPPVEYKVSSVTENSLLLETTTGPLTVWNYTRIVPQK